MNFNQELKEIKSIIGKFGILAKIKAEAGTVCRNASISDGSLENTEFDVIVRCDGKDFENIKRRLSSIKEISTDKIAENILGIRERK